VPRFYTQALIALVICLPLVMVVAAGIGAFGIPPWRIPSILWRQAEDEGYAVLAYIRFPRVVLAGIVGAALAVSGTALQGLFRNPLADPTLIGVTMGGSMGAAICIVLVGSTALGIWTLPLGAFAGSMAVVWILWKLGGRMGALNTATLLLAGIALNSMAGAVIGYLVYVSDDEELRSITFWQLGGLGHATWQLVFPTALLCAAGIALLLSTSRALNALALGESAAYHLGVSTEAMKGRIVFGSALAVGAGVAAAGGIGFIGLVVPHLLRLAIGADHRWLVPASALGGAILLIVADLGARTLVTPAELPVGVLTATIGGPFFLWLLLRYRKEMLHA
jgi:iron complex transport system permease protein